MMNNINNTLSKGNNNDDNDYVYCNKNEAIQRQNDHDIHQLESTNDTSHFDITKRIMLPSRIVKRYLRSSSNDVYKSYEPRTSEQLIKTVHYLLSKIWFIGNNDHNHHHALTFPLSIRYSFIMDRLQAVRQELVLCETSSDVSIPILCNICQYYIHSMHSTSSSVSSTSSNNNNNSIWYDSQLHETALNTCITRIQGSLTNTNNNNNKHIILCTMAVYSILIRVTDILKNIFNSLSSSSSSSSSILSSIQIPDLQCKELYPNTNGSDDDYSQLLQMSWKCVAALKQGNPIKMIKAFKRLLTMQKTPVLNAVHTLLLKMLPYIQIWLVLQLEKTSGKGDVINISSFISMIMLPNEKAASVLCNVIGLKISNDSNDSNDNKLIELKPSVSISTNVLKALSISSRWSHHSTIDIDNSDWDNNNTSTTTVNNITTLSNMIINNLTVSDDLNDWIIDDIITNNKTIPNNSTMILNKIEIEIVNNITDDVVEAFQRLIPQLSKSNPAPTKTKLEDILKQESCAKLIIAKNNNKIIGSLTLILFQIPTGIRSWIEDVVVDESQRGLGVGEMLTRFAVNYAKSQGARTIDLTSRPSREVANKLYQKVGFKLRDTNVYRIDL